MGFSIFVFVMGMAMLFFMQNQFEDTYNMIMEAVNGRYIW